MAHDSYPPRMDGNVNFEEIVRTLNFIGYEGSLSIRTSRPFFTVSFLKGKHIFWNAARSDPLHTFFISTLDSLTFDLCFDR